MPANWRDVESGRILERGRQPKDFSIGATGGPAVGTASPVHELALEKHYSVSELAQLWQLSEKTIRRMFLDEPGVVKWGHEEKRFKRAYMTLRIPESVVQRVHRRLRQAG
jgi:transcriptional regulator GlxA family with amidase domain